MFPPRGTPLFGSSCFFACSLGSAWDEMYFIFLYFVLSCDFVVLWCMYMLSVIVLCKKIIKILLLKKKNQSINQPEVPALRFPPARPDYPCIQSGECPGAPAKLSQWGAPNDQDNDKSLNLFLLYFKYFISA